MSERWAEMEQTMVLVDLGNGDLDAALIGGVFDVTDADRMAYALRGLAVPSYARSVVTVGGGRLIFSPLERGLIVERWLAALDSAGEGEGS